MNCLSLSSYVTDRSPSFSYSDSSTSTLESHKEFQEWYGDGKGTFLDCVYGMGRRDDAPSIKTRYWDEDCYQEVALRKHTRAEVNFMGRLSHPNLVKLLGYCWKDKEMLLIYEYMQRGSLENHLFRTHAKPLSWDIRLKIAIGAQGVWLFLHTSEKQVIYRDFKASNVLLDGSYNAKISGFGLAKLGHLGEDSHGYAAPEYIVIVVVMLKAKDYQLGPPLETWCIRPCQQSIHLVVLLQMLTGLRALDSEGPSGKQKLVDWVKPIISNKQKIKKIMDARIEGQYSPRAGHQVAQLTLRCLKMDPRKRPPMKDVVELLEQIAAICNPKEKQRLKSDSVTFYLKSDNLSIEM